MKERKSTPLSYDKPQVIGAAMVYFRPGDTPVTEEELNRRMGYLEYKWYYDDSPEMEEINGLFYAGPTRYGNIQALGENMMLIAIDKIAAYAHFLRDYDLPGRSRMRYEGEIYPTGDDIAIHTVQFDEKNPRPELIAFFFNNAGFKFDKLQYSGKNGISGWINIMSSKVDDGNLVNLFLELAPSAKIEYTTICTGEGVYINKENIANMIYNRIHLNSIDAKQALAQSTGWLSNLDKPAYYYMVQMVKYDLIHNHLKDIPFDRIVAINTDGALIALKRTGEEELLAKLMANNSQLMKVQVDVKYKVRGGEVYIDREVDEYGD